ncbi:MAG: hypothetical protein K0S74_721 [Chlamydiales bacterium]|jgi:biopolymer transport protein ExbD|nr:hypothetical protein [Chlamydiales bacterium]
MSFLPENEIKSQGALNMAPMIDFLFLMLSFFACLSVSRITTRDTEVNLVEVKPEAGAVDTGQMNSDLKIIHISITADNEYKWITEIRDYKMKSPEDIAAELERQYQQGLLPADKTKTQVLLRIDKNATWEPILKVLFAIRDTGFDVRPLYEPEQ